MLDRFAESADRAVCLACAEADRLRHDYIGPEHVLVGLAQQDGSAAGILAGSGLPPEVISASLDQLVTEGSLPAPWRNKADLLAGLGIDLAAVQRAAEQTFGADAVSAASRCARSKSRFKAAPVICTGPPEPLAGKALLTKRAFEMARHEAARSGERTIAAEHLLLGVLRDAADPIGTGLSRGARRHGSYLGLMLGRPSPVRLVVERAGLSLESLRIRVLAELRVAS